MSDATPSQAPPNLCGVGEHGRLAHPPRPSANDDNEHSAIIRCQAGDADAFRTVVERHGDLLYGTAYLMLRDRRDAEETVQDAFVDAWRGIETFDASRPLRPWLIRILVHRALQRRRRRWLDLVPLSRSLPAASEDRAWAPEAAAQRAWEREELNVALASLPAETAHIVVLRFFAELTVPEVATALGMREGTVKSRLHRALRAMRADLLARGIGGDETENETEVE